MIGEGEPQIVEASHMLLAPGTKPARPAHIPFNGQTVFDSDEFLDLDHIPRSMIVVGGGVIGIEYGIMFATLGVHVTVVDGRERLLEFCDREIIDTLLHHARSLGMVFRLGESVVEIRRTGAEAVVAVELESGKRLLGETCLFSVGRRAIPKRSTWTARASKSTIAAASAATNTSKPGAAHLCRGRRRRLPRARQHLDGTRPPGRVPHVGPRFEPCPHMPYGLFTIPEISMVGQNEQQLTADRVPYEVGMARYREIARGQIAGDRTGMLKLLFHRETRKLLGVHVIGESATEIIHIGQAVMALGGTIDYFRDTVFNYPTMAECYKVAALDGLNKLLRYEDDCEIEDTLQQDVAELEACWCKELTAKDANGRDKEGERE